jgi:hypothetical protein
VGLFGGLVAAARNYSGDGGVVVVGIQSLATPLANNHEYKCATSEVAGGNYAGGSGTLLSISLVVGF